MKTRDEIKKANVAPFQHPQPTRKEGKMNEQELNAELETLYVGAVGKHLSKTEKEKIKGVCKAYADAQVAAKDAEIRNLESYVAQLESDNANNSMNLDSLTFQLSEANRVIDAGRDRIAALKADKERMREGIEELVGYAPYIMKEDFRKRLLSPADGATLHQSNTDIAAMLKEQVEENARLVDKLKLYDEIKPDLTPYRCQHCQGEVMVRKWYLLGKTNFHCVVFCKDQKCAGSLLANDRSIRKIQLP